MSLANFSAAFPIFGYITVSVQGTAVQFPFFFMKNWSTGSYVASGYHVNSSIGGGVTVYIVQDTSIKIDQAFVNGTEYTTGMILHIWKNYR